MATSLDGLKLFLRITHDEDDEALEALLEAAESDAMSFCGASELPVDPAVDVAVYMIARALFDAVTADDAERWRECGRRILWPHRIGLGA